MESAGSLITWEIVELILKRKDENLKLVSYKAEEYANSCGVHYNSLLFSLRITASGEEEKTENVSLIFKGMPRNPVRVEFVQTTFQKEAMMYSEVIPELVSFEAKMNVSSPFISYPKCICMFANGKEDYLVFEDLRLLKFRLISNMRLGLNFKHTKLVLKNLAHFHALSFGKYRASAETILQTHPTLRERTYRPVNLVPDGMRSWHVKTFSDVKDVLLRNGCETEANNFDRLILDNVDEFFITMFHLMGPNHTKFPVITHGDCWLNNFLFKYDELDNEEPTDMRFVDWQLCRVTSPILEVIHVLFTSANLDVLKENCNELLRIYYEDFVQRTESLGWTDHGFTWTKCQEEYETWRYYGVIMGLIVSPLLLAGAEEKPEMKDISLKDSWNAIVKSEGNRNKLIYLAKEHLPYCKPIRTQQQ